ncbi:MAG: hypothetical protein IPL55_02140 [Saprospiraceae bacterium]|jgi:hypothetical protein|nr:hypothetical protein [Saprospiraceae bacterium]MBL0025956.1 hypothetical protein [Saprospiraceae bacterium]
MKFLPKNLFVFIALFFLISCSKSDDDYTSATVVGYDLRLCPCCGGFFVSLDDKPDEVYQWYQRQGDMGINEKEKYPLKVKIKYYFLAKTCTASAGEIEITDLIKLK